MPKARVLVKEGEAAELQARPFKKNRAASVRWDDEEEKEEEEQPSSSEGGGLFTTLFIIACGLVTVGVLWTLFDVPALICRKLGISVDECSLFQSSSPDEVCTASSEVRCDSSMMTPSNG